MTVHDMPLHDHAHPATAMSTSGIPWHELALPLMALAAVAALVGVFLRGRLGGAESQGHATRPAPVQTSLQPVLAALAVLWTAAAGIHLAVIREHFIEAPALGWFFLSLTVGQLAYAALVLVHPRRWILAAGIAGNLAVVGLWIYTRTVGIPFGVGGGEIEAVGLADVVSAAIELAAVAAAVQVLRIRAAASAAGIRLTGTSAGWGLMVVAVAGAAVSGVGVGH